MSDDTRPTKKQRRAEARSARSQRATEAVAAARRDRWRRGGIAVAAAAVGAGFVYQAFFAGPATLDEAILVGAEEVEHARGDAGCEVVAEREPLPEAGHFDATERPPGDLIYPDLRPTHSGSHTSQTLPPITGGASNQIDEMSVTHNLEHGSVVVWYDPAQVDEDTAAAMGDWSRLLNDSGFVGQGGSAVFVSPYEEPGISSGKAIALRAWGTAVDCDDWDETVANGFVAEHFGTRGVAPEGHFAGYPRDVLDLTEGS